MATAAKVYRRVKEHLEKNNYAFKSDYKNKNFIAIIPLKGKLKESWLHITCDEISITVLAYIEQNDDEEYHANVMEFLARANLKLVNGSFDFDPYDDSITYKLILNLLEIESLSDDLIGITLAIPRSILGYYGDALLDVKSGEKAPVDAINEIFETKMKTAHVVVSTTMTTMMVLKICSILKS